MEQQRDQDYSGTKTTISAQILQWDIEYSAAKTTSDNQRLAVGLTVHWDNEYSGT